MAENIIINGVDVSGCDYFKNNGKCRIPHYQQNIKYTCCNCSEWSCYYKQLKRKEQECEGFKKTLAEIKEIAENSCCLQPTSDCEEYKNCKECRRISDDKTVQQILKKISEVENERKENCN